MGVYSTGVMSPYVNAFIAIGSYGFFDDYYTLRAKGYHGEDRFTPYQWAFMGGLFILLVILSVFLRKARREKLYLIYKILAIVMPISEIIKITYSSYFDIVNGEPFNWGGILPFYTCSMVFAMLPMLAWGKGKTKECAAAWFTTIGLVAGLSNFVYLSAASSYPILSYGGLYSVFCHAGIVFVGVSLLICGEYKVTWKSILYAMIPIAIFGLAVIPINFSIYYLTHQTYVDYMLLMNCNGFVPFISDWFIAHNVQVLFSFLVLLVGYPIATAIITGINVGLQKSFEGVRHLVKKKA